MNQYKNRQIEAKTNNNNTKSILQAAAEAGGSCKVIHMLLRNRQ